MIIHNRFNLQHIEILMHHSISESYHIMTNITGYFKATVCRTDMLHRVGVTAPGVFKPGFERILMFYRVRR